MKQEKDSKFRLPPELRVSMEVLIVDASADPHLLAKLERGGVITVSAMIRECISRGMMSIRTTIGKAPAPSAPAPKPAVKKKPAKKRRK
jgi:hypothetical protein